MIPIRSNLNKDNCTPISSNCVIWQGPDLPCINLCSGDSVSDVIYNLAVELCALKDQLNLKDIDIKCLLDSCALCPDPEMVLSVVLQMIIDKVCDLQTLIDALTGGPASEVLIRIASCFIKDNTDSNGNITTNIPISLYVQQIAQKLCALVLTVEGIGDDITNLYGLSSDLQDQINIINAQGELTVIPTCTGAPVATPIDTAVTQLEEQFCGIKTALVTLNASELLVPISKECKPEAPATIVESLSTPGAALWSGTSSNIAQTLEKMWLAICDLRGAVSLIQDTCCQVSCKDLIVDFDIILTVINGKYYWKLFFGNKTDIPTTFTDCDPTGTTLNFTDAYGHMWSPKIKIREDILNDPDAMLNGYLLENTGSIDVTTTVTIDADVCITNGSLTCVKCITKLVPYVAPVCEFCTITASGPVTIVYQICTTTTTTTLKP